MIKKTTVSFYDIYDLGLSEESFDEVQDSDFCFGTNLITLVYAVELADVISETNQVLNKIILDDPYALIALEDKTV